MEKKVILLVEDDAGIRELLILYLHNKGYYIIAVKNAKEALAMIHNESLHLILLDIEIRGIYRSELCEKIRQLSDIPIICMCSQRSVIQQQMSFKLEQYDYITKPFKFDVLEAKIKAILY